MKDDTGQKLYLRRKVGFPAALNYFRNVPRCSSRTYGLAITGMQKGWISGILTGIDT